MHGSTWVIENLKKADLLSRVVVLSEYHLKVKCLSGAGYHDLWITKDGHVKYRLHGNRGTNVRGGIKGAIASILAADNSPGKTDLDIAREMVGLAILMQEARSALPQEVAVAVWVDAGWKDGIAEYGAVLAIRGAMGVDVDASSHYAETSGPQDAERLAIKLGVELAHPNIECPIYTDCLNLVRESRELYGPRVVWQPRKGNHADKIANRRGRRA